MEGLEKTKDFFKNFFSEIIDCIPKDQIKNITEEFLDNGSKKTVSKLFKEKDQEDKKEQG